MAVRNSTRSTSKTKKAATPAAPTPVAAPIPGYRLTDEQFDSLEQDIRRARATTIMVSCGTDDRDAAESCSAAEAMLSDAMQIVESLRPGRAAAEVSHG